MARAKKLYTLIEFGTDKICVLFGTRDEAGNPEVIAFAQQPSGNAVIKGTIRDEAETMRLLKKTLEDAEKSLPFSGGRDHVYYIVNGTGVTSRQGEGTVMIYEDDHKVTREHVDDAITRAQSISYAQDRVKFSIYDSFFLLNGTQRVKNPIGETAERLDASIHIVSAPKKDLERINTMLRDLGFEHGGEPVFAPLASVYGALNSEERDQGVLLIDFGAGTCSFSLIHAEGVLLSEVIPVGMDHAANDLAIGLDLPFEYCRDFLRHSKLETLRSSDTNYVEYEERGSGKIRRIPLDSFEKILDLRLRETFSFIQKRLEERQLLNLVTQGCVLCGGGSMLPGAKDILQNVTGLHVRIGEPLGITGAMTGFDYAQPCYTAIFGLLKYAIAVDSDPDSQTIGDVFAKLTDSIFGKAKKVFNI